MLLTLQEAAARLRVSTRTVKREIAAGRLQSVRIRRLVRVPEASLRVYLATACRSANETTVGKSESALVLDAALRKLSHRAPHVPTRSRSKLLIAAQKSMAS